MPSQRPFVAVILLIVTRLSYSPCVCVRLRACVLSRLLVDAQEDTHYRSWFAKVIAALRHCCGRVLRQELECESLLVTLLVQVADTIRNTDKAKRKVVPQCYTSVPLLYSLNSIVLKALYSFAF